MGTDQPTPKRRWRPRFSLLTLVLGVLFVSACGGLWWRWEPWYFNAGASSQISKQTPESFKGVSMLAPDRVRCLSCNEGMIRRFLHGDPIYSFAKNGGLPGRPVGFLGNDTFLFKTTPDEPIASSFLVYSRRRPEYWWGLAWLPESWIALLSGGALVVIAVRNQRRRFAKPKAAQTVQPEAPR